MALPVGVYFAMAYVTVFCNAALISQAHIALRGGDPSVAAGLRAAGSKWLRIVPWALISATVSWLLRWTRKQAEGAMVLLTDTAGTAWQVIVFLVLPKLVLEDRRTLEAIKNSASSLRNTWGENVVGNASLGLFGIVLALPGAGLIFLANKLSGAALWILFAVGVVWLLATVAVTAALTGIYQTALYQFARDGSVPESFATTDLPRAFIARPSTA